MERILVEGGLLWSCCLGRRLRQRGDDEAWLRCLSSWLTARRVEILRCCRRLHPRSRPRPRRRVNILRCRCCCFLRPQSNHRSHTPTPSGSKIRRSSCSRRHCSRFKYLYLIRQGSVTWCCCRRVLRSIIISVLRCRRRYCCCCVCGCRRVPIGILRWRRRW